MNKPLPDDVLCALIAFRAISEDFPQLMPSDVKDLADQIHKKLLPLLDESAEGNMHVAGAPIRILRTALAEREVLPESPGKVVLSHVRKPDGSRELVAVTRQDREGRILRVIWEKPQ